MKVIAILVAAAILAPPDSITKRFSPMAGYHIVTAPQNSFGEYLQQLPLKPEGTKTYTYDNQVANTDAYTAAVIDLDRGTSNLQQCADAVMRLRSEYLWQQKKYADIHFNFTSGFRCDYIKYAEGYRYVSGKWVKQAAKSYTYATFRKYLNLVYSYAGTASLEKELKTASGLAVGKVFIRGGFPGHCFIIMNMAVNNSGDTIFQLAQSFYACPGYTGAAIRSGQGMVQLKRATIHPLRRTHHP